MAYTATNQQLAYARVQARAASTATATVAKRAHWQAGVVQLNMAMECYAGELLGPLKLSVAVPTGARMFYRLQQAVHAAGKASADLDELVLLEQSPGSWLALVQAWAGALPSLGAEIGRSSVLAETSLTALEKPAVSMIEVVNLNARHDVTPRFNESKFIDALEQAVQLVQRQRESSAEY